MPRAAPPHSPPPGHTVWNEEDLHSSDTGFTPTARRDAASPSRHRRLNLDALGVASSCLGAGVPHEQLTPGLLPVVLYTYCKAHTEWVNGVTSGSSGPQTRRLRNRYPKPVTYVASRHTACKSFLILFNHLKGRVTSDCSSGGP